MESVKGNYKKKKKDTEAPSAPKGLKVSRIRQIRDWFSKRANRRASIGGKINEARKKREKMLKEAAE